MKILVVNTANPFMHGGAEELANNLVSQLGALNGIEAQLLSLPFTWEPAERLLEEILIHQDIRIPNADRVIALKFPAYLVQHERKTLWLLHQFRQVYDFDEAGLWPRSPEHDLAKRAIRNADNPCFAAAERLFVNSPTTWDRLKRFNGFDAEILYPPVNDPELFTGGDYGGYIFAGGRVGEGKRQHLLIEAMAKARPGAKLVVAGPPDTLEYANRLRMLVARHNLEDRVELSLKLHSRAEIADYVNGALACAYIPYDEDSLGYVTMEAFAAAKAVLTTTDSGGLLEIVSKDTGAVVAPQPEALAEGLNRLASNPRRTRALGAHAKEVLGAKGLNWPQTLERLLGDAA